MLLFFCSDKSFEDTHENTHYGKNKQIHQCDFTTVQAGNLRRHLKAHSGEKLKNALNVILHLFMRVL